MKRTIDIELNYDSIMDAVRYLEQYRTWAEQKTEQLVKALMDRGYKVVMANQNTPGDSQPGYAHFEISSFGTQTRATLHLEGRDVLFIEFGAGVHYNGAAGSSPNPYGEPLGYVIGSYGQGKGAEDSWVYVSDDGTFKTSHGTQASMPMWKADIEIISSVASVAKEVFG